MRHKLIFHTSLFLSLCFASYVAVAQNSPTGQKANETQSQSSLDQIYFGNAGHPKSMAVTPSYQNPVTSLHERIVAPNSSGDLDQRYFGNAGYPSGIAAAPFGVQTSSTLNIDKGEIRAATVMSVYLMCLLVLLAFYEWSDRSVRRKG